MSDQLATQLRDLVDNGAPPIALAELELASMTAIPPRAHRRWPFLAAAAAVVLVVVGAVVTAVARDDAPDVAVQGGRGDAPVSTAPNQAPGPGSTLVTSWEQQYVGYVFIYADGRVIFYQNPGPENGDSWQRHLNAAGLNLVRSGKLATGEIIAGTVPSNAWADPNKSAWKASEYAACLWQHTSTSAGPFLGPADSVVARLPLNAKSLLGTPTTEQIATPGSTVHAGPDVTCFRLTPQRARAAGDLPDDLIAATTSTPAIGVLVLPVLPDGKLLVWGS